MPRRSSATCLLLAAALGLPPPPGQAQVNLPALGDSVSESVDVGAERRLGEQVMREIRRDPDYLDDPLLLEYVQSIWQPLVAAARARGDIGADTDSRFAWEAFLVRDRSVNAFALPGGYVGVHLGLIAVTASRDELASVLAHELSHVTQRHIARGIVNESRQSLIGLAAMIVGIIAAARSARPDAANALITGGQAAAIQGMLNFSRDMEREADRVGFALLDGAGFASSGMASMFEKLDHAARLNDSNGYPYLRTHPLTTERIGEARSRQPVSLAGSAAAAADSGSRFEHELMRARARVLMDPRTESLRRLQALESTTAAAPGGAAAGTAAAGTAAAERLGALAASVQASLVLREPTPARSALDAALALAPAADMRGQRQLTLLHAQVALAGGDAAGATRLLRPFEHDSSRPLLFARARLALAGGEMQALRRSADELQTRTALVGNDAATWALLGDLWSRLDQPLRSLRAQAESHAAAGDLNGAIDRLRAGQRLARSGGVNSDHIEASVIDARARDLQAQRRALAAEFGAPR